MWITKFNRLDSGSDNGYSDLNYAGACKVLQTAAERAGIKKRIYPRLLRHSRATVLANKLTEAQLKEMFGWIQGSNMASVYIHLSGQDVDNALLELHGLANREQKDEEFSSKFARDAMRRTRQTPDTARYAPSPLTLT